VTNLRLLGRRHLTQGAFLRIERLHFVDARGRHVAREVVHHPGAVGIVPVVDGDVLLISQERVAIGDRLLEIPAGKRDKPAEPLEETAVRECEEEIGFHPGTLEPIGRVYTTPGFSDEMIWLFLATDLTPVPPRPQGPEEEAAQIVRVPIAEALRRVDGGKIVDAKTIIGLHVLRREIGS
jgi:ADP-ribose pyrophosphatase